MTAAADLERLADADERELDRLAGLADLIRQVPAQLGPPVPPPLHRIARIAERRTTS